MASETVRVNFTPAELFALCKAEFEEDCHAELLKELQARFPGGISSRITRTTFKTAK